MHESFLRFLRVGVRSRMMRLVPASASLNVDGLHVRRVNNIVTVFCFFPNKLNLRKL